MLRSYFIQACRNFVRNRIFSLINVLGLTVGLTAFLLIVLYVRFEFSYDDFHHEGENIFRINTKVTLQNEVINHESSSYDGIIRALRNDFPEVKAVTVISTFTSDEAFIRFEDSNKNLTPVEKFTGCYADDSFFSVFSFPLTNGDANTVLQQPYTAVISESFALRYFENNAIGKVLEFKDDDKPSKHLRVSGVMKDVPSNSHIQFDVVLNLPEEPPNSAAGFGFWDWRGHVYMRLDEGAVPSQIEHTLDQLAQANNGLKTNKDDYGQVSTFTLQALNEIHLFSDLDYEFQKGGSRALVYTLLCLAILILVIAWVNYINLSTAISTRNVKEIGIRKVVGASRPGLVLQVLVHAAFLNGVSVLFAVILAWMLLPVFSDLVGAPVEFIEWSNVNVWLAAGSFIFLSAAIAGGYPALVISGVYPIQALKGKGAAKGLTLRKSLVVFQFALAIILVITCTVASRQLSFMQSKKLGINIDQVLIFKALNFDKETWSDAAGGYVVDSVYQRKSMIFQNELRRLTAVGSVTSLSHLPGQMPEWGTEFRAEDIDPHKAVNLKAIGIDYDFIPAFQAKLLAGRNFSRDFPSDQGNEERRAVLINETSCKLLGYTTPHDAIGRHISTYWGADYEVVGVLSSFHQLSPKENLTPLYFVLQPRALSYFAVQLRSKRFSHSVEQIKGVWETHFPDYPFNYFFLDRYFNQQYQSEEMFARVTGIFTGLALFIGCMGLFGLTAYSVVQRTKEVGIRKVLGASVSNVIALFSVGFVKLILIANFIAVPLAYAGMAYWLNGYAYKVSLSWWLFALPVVGVLVIALITVCLQTYRVAVTNPVETLKHE
jgi:putative ABC transport system permease protein